MKQDDYSRCLRDLSNIVQIWKDADLDMDSAVHAIAHALASFAHAQGSQSLLALRDVNETVFQHFAMLEHAGTSPPKETLV